MKPSAIFLIALSLAAVSCINSIEIQVDSPDPVPVVNAHFRTDETEHFIYLTTSLLSRTEPLDHALVSVSVNGGPGIQAVEIVPEGDYHESSKYGFEAVFRAGDEVTVRVRKDSFEASSSVVFPKAPAPFSVGWSSQTIEYTYGTEEAYRYDIRFEDIKGEDSFYRLDMDIDLESTSYYEGDTPADPTVRHILMTGSYLFDASSDPVINEGRSGENGLFSELMNGNTYSAFSDQLFRDSSCEIRATILRESFKTDDYDLSASRVVLKPVVLVKLLSMDFSYFRYLKSLDNFETFGYEMGLLTEPTTLPTNVTGGLGFVSAETCTTYAVEMPEIAFSSVVYY